MLCSPKLHLFDQKYGKILLKCYYKLRMLLKYYIFTILNIIYHYDGKAEFLAAFTSLSLLIKLNASLWNKIYHFLKINK